MVKQPMVLLMMAMPVAAWDAHQDHDERMCLAFGLSVLIYVTSAAMAVLGYQPGDVDAIVEEENDDRPRWCAFPLQW